MNIAIEMVGITKRFGEVVANDKINLKIAKGEIHAIVGENGAGKTTLMNVLYGLCKPDDGKIKINGKDANICLTGDAINCGIGMVHQHFMLIKSHTVVENVIVGKEPGSNWSLNKKEAIKKINKLSNKYNLEIEPRAKVKDISVGMQQRVEILKTLYRGAEIIIFDEPTAVLAPQEIEGLFKIFRNLKSLGKTIIFITHKLDEVIKVSDKVTVLRKGIKVGEKVTNETDTGELTKMMVGREVFFGGGERKKFSKKKVALKIENLSLIGEGDKEKLKNINLELEKGEILGLAGIDNNGQQELVQSICGQTKPTQGKVFLEGIEVSNKNINCRRDIGLGHIPEDRLKQGLVMDFSVANNMILGFQYKEPFASKRKWLNIAEIRKSAKNLVKKFDVRTCNIDEKVKNLSGGNQQKIIIARELNFQPHVLIVFQPTRGLDVGAIEFVHETLVEARNNGKAILLISFELEELLDLSDRIAVINSGEIRGILNVEEATKEKLGSMMLDSKKMLV